MNRFSTLHLPCTVVLEGPCQPELEPNSWLAGAGGQHSGEVTIRAAVVDEVSTSLITKLHACDGLFYFIFLTNL